MLTFLQPGYYLYFLYFFFAAFLAFYVPGNFFISRLNLSLLPKITYSLIFGIVLWALQGFIFGFLNLRNFSYIYLIIFLILWLKFSLNDIKTFEFKIDVSRKDLPIVLILILGVGTQMLFTAFNGIYYKDGINFCCSLPDNLYHMGLTHSLVNAFPPFEPAMYGVVVKNYHYLGNLVSADLIRVFHLPLIYTQTTYITFLISLLLGLSVISLGKILKLGNLFTSFFLFFIFFAGDATYLLTSFLGKGINFNFPFLYDATALWFSPPRAFANTITLMALGLFSIWVRKDNKYLGTIIAIVFASLLGFKIYIGISVFIGLLFVFFYFIYKKDFSRLWLIGLSILLGLLIYLPVNNKASGLSYVGFWRVENFIAQPGFGLSQMELARQVYVDHHNIPRIVEYEFVYSLLYFIFVFGILNIAFFQNKKTFNFIPKELNIFLLSSIGISLLLGFFSFQRISGANTSQFLISAEMFVSIYAAFACTFLFRKLGPFKFIFLAIVILLTIPRVANKSLANYSMIRKREGFFVSKEELEALNYLKNNTPSSAVIFSDNKSLNAEKTCYYVAFLSDRNLFLCDATGILDDHGVDISKRNKDYNFMIKNLNGKEQQELMKKDRVDYLYLSRDPLHFVYDNKNIKKVFENDKIRIMRVNR